MKAGLSTIEKHYLPFRPWWKSDDQAWLEKRKAEWPAVARSGTIILSGGTPRQFEQLSRFYVFGEETSAEDERVGNRPTVSIDGLNRYFLTPLEGKSQAALLFEGLESATGKRAVWSSYMAAVCRAYGARQAREKVVAFRDAVLGDRFAVMRSAHSYWGGLPNWGRSEPEVGYDVTGGRGSWAQVFIASSLQYLNGRNRKAYHYSVDCIPYFVSMLLFMQECREQLPEMLVRSRNLESLLDILGRSDHRKRWNAPRRQFAEELCAAAESGDAPDCLKRALRR